MAKMTEKTRPVFDFLQANQGTNVTAQDIATALGVEKRSVDGIVTGMQKKGLTVRTPAEVEVTAEDGTPSHKMVKFISLTAEGVAYNPDAEVAAE